MDRPHLCTYCSRSFRRPEHLQRHTRTHTKEKPYACPCGSSFARRDLLRRHERLVHDPTAAAPANIQRDLPSTASSPRAEIIVSLPGASPGAETGPSQTSISSGTSLPLPPEYHHLYSTLVHQPPEDNPLHDFTTFLHNSGLRQLACAPELPQPQRLDSHPTPDDSSTADPIGAASTATSYLVLSRIETRYTGVSDDRLQPYLEKLGGFRLPPVQSIERYFKAYMESSHIQFIHKSIDPDDTHVALNLAMLALGAQILLEDWNATSLFKASRSIALHVWTSQDKVQPEGFEKIQLTGVFLLLIEYITRDQPITIIQELGILQGASISSLETDELLVSDTQETDFGEWAEAESNRRMETFGLCKPGATFDFRACPALGI
ncbi:hypothetical protein AK830_g5555 [Neonectria ditissima]|uniref:C2H2-type domain-containing protein n=1 Tax=Neonectria ditissima TaxID=78410 RepID=A0A0P7BLK1_9HYPO|nr:hypothetical protein AK830_g5555 [Neonectria ditissima]